MKNNLKLRILEVTTFALVCAFLALHMMPRAWRSLNTDFPNYYLTATLAREGFDTSRAYEWIWLQRQKDHRGIDQRIVGLVPITPFSTLAMWPIAGLPILTAKHIWLAFNFALLSLTAILLRALAKLSLLRIWILFGLSFPLHRNFLYGQYYVILLCILAAACWACQSRRSHLAGALVGLAAALKVFPILLGLYFLRKKDWKALFACGLTCIIAVLISVEVFGGNLHLTYLRQVLPWTLRGDCLDPYNLSSASVSSVLHRLFIYEPQWNPHPAIRASWLFPILHPILQLTLLAPVILLLEPKESDVARIPLEWAALLLATLTITPLPASYHFTVLVLPISVLLGHFLASRHYPLLAAAALLYLAVGYPGWNTSSADGWDALWHVPRLYALVFLTLIALGCLKQRINVPSKEGQPWWVAGMFAVLAVSVLSGLRHQRGLFADYAYRLPMPQQGLLASHPAFIAGYVHFVALVPNGYREAAIHDSAVEVSGGSVDQLSFASNYERIWTETVALQSNVESSFGALPSLIMNAESPAVANDARSFTYLREIEGHNQLFLRELDNPGHADLQLTFSSSSWNVYEATFQPNGTLVMSATQGSGEPELYYVSRRGDIRKIGVGEARYPAVSPDGRWLAYSHFEAGDWNLSLLEVATGKSRRITKAPCNQIEPAWELDSKTLLYSSDCGRALWLTAICERRVLP